MGKFILDPCCGSKMFYYNKASKDVLYCDNREVSMELCDGRKLEVHPDKICDVLNLPFKDETFQYIIFDPPHLIDVGQNSWLAQKYGSLPLFYDPWLCKAFSECFRVLKTGGLLLFKWSERDVSHKSALNCALPYVPLFGDKKGETRWTFFVKTEVGNES